MNNDAKTAEQLKQEKALYKVKQDKLKVDLKLALQEKGIFNFQKEQKKTTYRNNRDINRKEHRDAIKRIKDPVHYEAIKSSKILEKQIYDLKVSAMTTIEKAEKALKKAQRHKAPHAEINQLKLDVKRCAMTTKASVKQEVETIVANNGVSKFGMFRDDALIVSKKIYKKTMPVLGKISNQKHLVSIRNAFSTLIPLIMIASFITVIRSIPTGTDPNGPHSYLYTYFPAVLDNALVTTSNLTMGLMSVGLAFAIGINLGSAYGEGALISGIMGFLGFILWVGPENIVNSSDQGLPLSDLGSKGLFVSIITSMIMVELYHTFKKYNITIRLPKAVPPAVGNSFLAIIPSALYAIVVLCIRYIANFDFINELTEILKPIGSAINDNLGAVVLIIVFNSLFWWFGIHGSAITGIITYPFWYPAIAQNTSWFQGGGTGFAPNTYVEPFYQWAVWIGGAGSTIGLAISSVFFSRSKQNKAMSKVTIIPAIFNISEPMMFGYPVVLNIILFIPFMFAPIITALVSAALVKVFVVNWVIYAPWSLPAPIGAFLASGDNWRAIVVSIVAIVVSTLVYMPFFKMYDKKLLKDEQQKMVEMAEKSNMTLEDYLKKQELEARNKWLEKQENKKKAKQLAK